MVNINGKRTRTRHREGKMLEIIGKPQSKEWGNHGRPSRPKAHLAYVPQIEEQVSVKRFNNEKIKKIERIFRIS